LSTGEGQVSARYADGSPIRLDDEILLDGEHCGTVQGIFEPATDDAVAYSCGDTGGLLIMLEHGILVLEPFGHLAFVERRERAQRP